MYLNFGEIGANIQGLVKDYQEKQKTHAKIESIADMKVLYVHTYIHIYSGTCLCDHPYQGKWP